MTRSSSVLFLFGLILIASLAFYRTSDRVRDLNTQLHDINAAIETEQKSIHVLKAEWVYLANPARIEAIAKKHLAMRPASPQQITQMNTLSEVLPTRSEAMASVSVTSTPIANIKTTLASLRPKITAFVKHKTHVAAAAPADTDHDHINDHMTMERTASAAPLPDSIGSLINDLDSHQ